MAYKDPDKQKEYQRKWLASKKKDLEFAKKSKEYKEAWNKENIDKVREHDKKYRENNREILSKKRRERYESNKEEEIKKSNQWRMDNPKLDYEAKIKRAIKKEINSYGKDRDNFILAKLINMKTRKGLNNNKSAMIFKEWLNDTNELDRIKKEIMDYDGEAGE